MIQLSSRKKLIILVSIISIIVILIIIMVVTKDKETTVTPVVNTVTSTQPIVRDMTREEKIKVGISPTQEAEVVNDQNGLFIYKIKK